MQYVVKEGKNLKTEEPLFYAMACPVQPVKLSAIADEISQECTVTRHDILAVISSMEEKIIAHLQSGQSVRLGMLGSFAPTIKSKSSPSLEEFTPENLRSVGVAFRPSTTMKYQLSLKNPNVTLTRVA